MKKIYVTKSSLPTKEEYYQEIEDIWESHLLTNMGSKHEKLEKQLKEYLNVEYISLFVNGHMALELSIQALKLTGEIITTPFSFASTTHAIVRNGLKPVFCDINQMDYTIDVNKIEELITPQTSAILPVHVYGHICEIEKIQQIADKYGLKIIYDAAHAFGEKYRGIGVGNFGDVSMLSFHATKVFNTIEGGGICYKNKIIGEQLYKLKNFGITSESNVEEIGANAKMNEFQAAMGICNLKYIEREIDKREQLVKRYRKNLHEVKEIILPPIQENVKSNFSYFPILLGKDNTSIMRDNIYEKLKEKGIYSRKYFYPLINQFQCYKDICDASNTPIAVQIANNVLTLPLYADLELEDVDWICDNIKSVKGDI